ncbi:hypothetical protein QAD02_011750 [Eretmocerus hayati]|uniref:Uncharacterized protein n=1 Tax=Eretmocerus hayati TaxID=131215 RepID=A0ACC2P0B2_9HYME|nr:hypothetical protein QAD02_011750 [Eretmocerus hayati]
MANSVTFATSINMSVIKYWGKRNEELVLPMNGSIGLTMDSEHLCAKTTIEINPEFKEDRIWLNGKEETMQNPRLQNCLREIKKRAQVPQQMVNWKIHIWSENNFPTAAGLASSAAGYACLTTALAKLYKIEGNISGIARFGSGSACRAAHGGFVRWYPGFDDLTGSDCISETIFPASHWPEMRILVVVVNDSKKKVSSIEGMTRTVQTSEFMKYRAEKISPKRIDQMLEAITNKDFEMFAELTNRDSNEMHGVCWAAYPPIFYNNDTTLGIIELIHLYNNAKGGHKVAYTVDAGPNATLFLLEKDVTEFLSILHHHFPIIEEVISEYFKGMPVGNIPAPQELLERIKYPTNKPGKLKYIIYTKVGDGPKQLPDCEAVNLQSQFK